MTTGCDLDGDAALLLEIHRVEVLVRHVPLRAIVLVYSSKTVGQRRLAVVDVSDDAEIAGVGAQASTSGGYLRELGEAFHDPRLLGAPREVRRARRLDRKFHRIPVAPAAARRLRMQSSHSTDETTCLHQRLA